MCSQMVSKERVLMGIDGGGTKTEFVLFTETGQILHKQKLSRSNPNDIGLVQCCEILSEGIDLMLQKVTTVSGVFAGIAGCSTGNNGERVETYLRRRYPSIHIAVDTDGENVLSCNTNSADSMALICGTGSVLFAREKGIRHRIGGWGYLFDESGSAYDIGKDALRAALSQLDGMGERTILSDLLKVELKADIWDSLGEVYQKGKSYIASLAPVVFRAYMLGDRVAEAIIQKSADHLALLIDTAMKKYECGNSVVACGGLIEHFREILVPMIEKSLQSQVEFVFPDVPPVYGACVESCRRAGIMPGKSFYEIFCTEYLNDTYN